MIIEFSVENYKSFKTKQTLSMVASADKEFSGNLISPSVKGLKNVKLLNSAILYGANASGKSNLLEAMRFMSTFVTTSATKLKPEEPINVSPFKLNSKTAKQPSTFGMDFIHENVRYQYGFVLDRERVFEEWLYAFPKGQPQLYFSREFNGKVYEWKMGPSLKGEKESLKEKTRPNNLFLSVAAQFNNKQLNHVYSWFRSKIYYVNCSDWSDPSHTIHYLKKDQNIKDEIIKSLKKADLDINDINLRTMTSDEIKFPKDLPSEVKNQILEEVKEGKFIDLSFIHKQRDTQNLIKFGIDEESHGTIKFFSLLGFWLDSINQSRNLLVDEIASNMHPNMVSFFIQSFLNASKNSANMQLLMTTHNTDLLDAKLFRRDQIWFTEKNREGETILYSLNDYKPRKEEALQKGYLAGRYGAIPFLEEEFSLK